jgi:outer membrane lipoprotein-sorting protein
MKKMILVVALAALSSAGLAFADAKGEQIARQYHDLKSADDTSGTTTMVLIDASGNKKTRSLEMFARTTPEAKSSFINFLSPADVAGTKFLTVKKTGGESDQRLWLPALKKTRKIAASGKGGDFMGSDLSYYDMESHELADSDYTFLAADETLADPAFKGMKFDKLEIKPKDPAAPYSKTIGWVNQENHFMYKIEAYGKDGNLLKTIQMVKVELISGVLMATQTLVENHQKNTKTLLQLSKLKINSGLKADIFTVQNLER